MSLRPRSYCGDLVEKEMLTNNGEDPFMRLGSRRITYADFIYVTFNMFNVLNVFAAVKQKRQVNLIK